MNEDSVPQTSGQNLARVKLPFDPSKPLLTGRLKRLNLCHILRQKYLEIIRLDQGFEIVPNLDYPKIWCMKHIVAVVKPFLAEKLIASVATLDVDEISVREVKGYGRQKNYLDRYGENEYSLAFVPKVEVSVWAQNDIVENVLTKMTEIARTGRLGDGKIFVMPVAEAKTLSKHPSY